jgi:methylenetetrahydrofolate reductase (NADPH)
MENNRFKEALLERKEFIYTLELVPGRGSRGRTQDEVIAIAKKAAKSKLVHALSITDNPGGHPALSPHLLGLEISRLGIDPLIHFTC